VRSVSASVAAATYAGPILLVHGTDDRVVPRTHLARLIRAANGARANVADPAPVEVLRIEGGHHSWHYEFRDYRSTVARFLAEALGGLDPATAAAVAADTEAVRMPDAAPGFSAMEDEPGGLRTLVRAIREA
jgi:dienelactone hydrolase